MASIANINGRRFAQFAMKGARRTASLGRTDEKTAQVARAHIERLLAHVEYRQPVPRGTTVWLEEIGDKLHAKLVKLGMALPRGVVADAPVPLGSFFDAYLKGRTDLKYWSLSNLRQVKRWLIKHFGEDRDIRTITRGDAGDWHRLIKQKLAGATVAAHVKKARQVFQNAVDRKLIAENPIKGLRAGSMVNKDRQRYIPVADVIKVINACPDIEWKLFFALARFGGLRITSEAFALRWSDIRWDEGRMTVRSSKTEHHQGKATRDIPIFPELLPYLRDAFESAEAGAVHVIVRHRGLNPRTTALKIIDRAGVKLWPRMFQNLRSSRETDLTASFPLHVVCAWIGNTQAIAMNHYLQVTDAHFEMGARGAAPGAALQPGQYLTGSDHDMQNTPANIGNLNFLMPPVGFAEQRRFRTFMRVLEKAQRKALHQLKKAAPFIRRDGIARLQRAVDAARPRLLNRKAVRR